MGHFRRVRPIGIYRKQQDFVDLDCWLQAFIGGRGTGKTWTGSYKVIKTAKKREKWLAVSPDSGVVSETTFPTFIEVAKLCGVYVREKLTPYRRVWFRTQDGGTASIVFRSGERPEKLRGGNYAGLWIDEASVVMQEAFDLAIATLRWYGKMGKVILTLTPKGKTHWTFSKFYQPITDELIDASADVEYIQGRAYRRVPDARIVQAHTLENPFLPTEFYRLLRSQYSTMFAEQELGGLFVDIAGLLFRREWFLPVDQAPRDAMRVRYWDRACLVAGTIIATIEGNKPIEQVRVGDFVLTRNGYRRVSWSGITKRVSELVRIDFNDGSHVIGTADHLCYTRNRGWVELQNLQGNDRCLRHQEEGNLHLTQNLLSSTDRDTRDVQESVTSKLVNGTETESGTITNLCIEQSGLFTTEVFPKVIKYITLTATGTITQSVIFSASQDANMLKNMSRTEQAKHACQIQSIEKKHFLDSEDGGIHCHFNRSFAMNVERISRASHQAILPNTVQNCVVHEATSEHASLDVPVYDLTVEDEHEFFANGVLVHNCTPGGGSYSAGVLLAVDPRGVIYIEDAIRGQWSWQDRNRVMIQKADEDLRKYNGEVVVYTEQEGASGGKEVSQQIVRMLAGHPVFIDNVSGQRYRTIDGQKLPGEAKVIRAMGLSGQAEAGNVRIVRGAWNADYLDEMVGFPETTYSDQVDATSGAFNRIMSGIIPNSKSTPGKTRVASDSASRFGALVALERAKQRGR
jgi:predicted phage terminase large subunit-like protein